ncbi:GNAT family N-acetyltransferase [Actinomadura meyerae]|uniref:GNAT family N-acetyltransferase n=1 Tax=Actinomadura meyerae TaxID=240840 RepID=UPI001177393D|nr:GNAT family N-acetyltransferase [Actinomadura meyerae]
MTERVASNERTGARAGEPARAEGFGFVDLADADDGTARRFYERVLAPAFPPSELVGAEEFRIAWQGPLPGFHGTIVLEDGEPVAGALGEYSAATGIMLLSYLAVSGAMRGRGVGGELLGAVLPKWRAELAPLAVLAEIEDPRFHRSGPHGDPVARVRFYDRAGARLLPFPYFQPSLRAGQPRVRDMLLISFDLDRDRVPAESLLRYLEEYVRESEGEDAVRRGDPEYLAMREAVMAWGDSVPLWPLSRLHEVPRLGGEANGARD